MATIPGSQLFDATTPDPSYTVGNGHVTIGETSDGTGLPAPTANSFNLEVWTGNPAGAPNTPASGYQGLAILTGGGHTLELISGAYAVTDIGNTGGNTFNVNGTNETVTGGSAFDNIILNGNNDVGNGGGGGNYIEVDGTGDTVNGGSGPDAIVVNTSGNTINGGTGADNITTLGNNEVIHGGVGPDTITAIGNGNTINGGTGADLINVVGTGNLVIGTANDTINIFGNNDTVAVGAGNESIGGYGDNILVNSGAGSAFIITTGSGDTVVGGGTSTTDALGTNFTFADSGPGFSDTVAGFSQAAGDSIKTPDNPATVAATATQNGADTVITFGDGSTLTLKDFNHNNVNASFFHS